MSKNFINENDVVFSQEMERFMPKSKGRKNFRRKIKAESDDSDDNEDDVKTKLKDLKELQNLRKRTHGISVTGLTLGKDVSVDEEVVTVGICTRYETNVDNFTFRKIPLKYKPVA